MTHSMPHVVMIAPQERRYKPVVQAGEEGYYESASDAQLYDLMGSPLGDLDEFGPQHSEDILVVTAAWCVPSAEEQNVERWLAGILREPSPWLTPWRQGEPAIAAHVWLDRSAALKKEGPAMLVVRLDNPYVHDGSLRSSMDQALARFDDLRRSFESRLNSAVAVPLARATLQWMAELHTEDDDDLETSLVDLDG